MTDIDKLKKDELNELNNTQDLQSLILEGVDARIPVEVEYITKTGEFAKAGAKLKPLSDTEVQNALRTARKVSDTTFNLELLRKGLFDLNGEPFPFEVLKLMNSGVVNSLANKLAEISGIELDPDDATSKQFAEDLMGF